MLVGVCIEVGIFVDGCFCFEILLCKCFICFLGFCGFSIFVWIFCVLFLGCFMDMVDVLVYVYVFLVLVGCC